MSNKPSSFEATLIMGHLLTSPDGSRMNDLSKLFKEIQESLSPEEGKASIQDISVQGLRQVISSLKGVRKLRRKSDGNAANLQDARENFVLPGGLAFEPWSIFRQKARPEEVDAVLFCSIFQIPEERLAQALFVSNGTIRSRLNEGLNKLGESLHIFRTVLNRP